MRNCDVLRCVQPGNAGVNVGTEETGRLDAWLCAAHKTAFDAGERWLWQWEETGPGSMLMGGDLPPIVSCARAKGAYLSNGGRSKVVTFWLRSSDGTESPAEFLVTEEDVARLGAVLGGGL
jgi:hypothetical protein